MTDILDDDELSPPGEPDFRRVGKYRIPFVIGPSGKRERYGRPSNAGKVLDDESNLTDWKLRTAIVGAAQKPDLMAKVSTLDPNQDKGEIRDIVEECIKAGKGKERAIKGEAVHAMFDHLDRGDDWQPAPQWVDLCNSYLNQLELWGLVPVDIEVKCINDEFRLAGSMDRRYRTTKLLVAPDGRTIPIGSMIAADTKTGAALEYASGSYTTQLKAYADSVRYNVETDERTPFEPPTNKDWALVVHADSGGTTVQLFWVDLDAGREGLQLAQQVKAWRQRSDLLTLAVGPVLLTSSPAPVSAPVVTADSPRTLSLYEHTRDRVRAVLGHSGRAGKQLQLLWPEDVPGLKAGGHTWEQLQEIIKVVEEVETMFEIPFFPAWKDPDAPAHRDLHPSNAGIGAIAGESSTQESEAITMATGNQSALIARWVLEAQKGDIDGSRDAGPMLKALMTFANINTDGWSDEPMSIDDQLTTFLHGFLRAMGYRGLIDLGIVTDEDIQRIYEAAFSITAGTAMLLYEESGDCVLRTNIVRGTK